MLLHLKLRGWVCTSPTQEPAISPQYFLLGIACPEESEFVEIEQIFRIPLKHNSNLVYWKTCQFQECLARIHNRHVR